MYDSIIYSWLDNKLHYKLTDNSDIDSNLNIPLKPFQSVQIPDTHEYFSRCTSHSPLPVDPGIAIRDWSLITGRGGLQNGRGGHVKFYPYKKGGRKKF